MNSMLQLTMSLIDDFSTQDWSSCGVRNLLVVGSILFCLSWFSSHSSREFSQFLRVTELSDLCSFRTEREVMALRAQTSGDLVLSWS